MVAVQQSVDAFIYVKEQTPEICMVAVKQNPRTLHDVMEQTFNICMIAVQEDSDAIKFIRDPEMRKRVEEAISRQVSTMSVF